VRCGAVGRLHTSAPALHGGAMGDCSSKPEDPRAEQAIEALQHEVAELKRQVAAQTEVCAAAARFLCMDAPALATEEGVPPAASQPLAQPKAAARWGPEGQKVKPDWGKKPLFVCVISSPSCKILRAARARTRH
jgi:hypothetical protein